MNGRDPGIQTWTNKYKNTIPCLLNMLSSPEHSMEISCDVADETYLPKLESMGVVTKNGSTYTLIIEKFAQISTVVPDDMYDNFQDINWLREQRKKLGMIQGRVKGEEFRSRQQARRRLRKQYAKEQRAKRLAKPPEELSMADIVFTDDTSGPRE